MESGSNLRVFPGPKPATLRDRKPALTSMFAGQSRFSSVGLTGFEPATPCPCPEAATDRSSFAETRADLRKHLVEAIQFVRELDLESGLLAD